MGTKTAYVSRVEIHAENIEQNPCCYHGPSVLFERIFQDGRRKKFYACSACRDRKLCPFYLEDNQIIKKTDRQDIKEKQLSLFNEHKGKFKKYLKILSTASENDIHYCKTCDMLFSGNLQDHVGCEVCENLKEDNVKSPSKIFIPKNNSKYQAQYFFTDESLRVLVQFMKDLKIKKVLCIGVPSIYEYVKNNLNMKSFLLDIDSRYCNFFSPKEFCVYNMFNHYFFEGIKGKESYETFLSNSDRLLVFVDPPFGGRLELISNTISIIESDWKRINNLTEDKALPVALIFPYFHEKSVKSNMPAFKMLDYQVNYINHDLYGKGPKGMKQGSAVRIFTNLSPHLFLFPSEEGYKFCNDCNRSVHPRNVHCFKCGDCTSKDGRTYIHCDLCGICVKPMWIHCDLCNKCTTKDHRCKDSKKSKKEYLRKQKKRKPIVDNPSSKKRKNIPETFSEEKIRDLAILQQVLSNKKVTNCLM